MPGSVEQSATDVALRASPPPLPEISTDADCFGRLKVGMGVKRSESKDGRGVMGLDGIRVMFLENREKTQFWANIARIISGRGYDIGWIVQNPIFENDLVGDVFHLPLPTKAQLVAEIDFKQVWPALATDRGRQHFNAGVGHYHHYATEISKILDSFRPTIVVGETTLFHELLTYELAVAQGIDFIQPTHERYPQDRMVLFNGLTQTPFIESAETCDPVFASEYAQRVADGAVKLSYMPKDSLIERLKVRFRWLVTRRRVLLGRLRGEIYNTPSMFRKLQLFSLVTKNHKLWSRLARPIDPNETAILYPLQVQPENTLDVWGRPYVDQVSTIKKLLSATPNHVLIALKSNPKPSVEMSDELMDFAKSSQRVRLLPHFLNMAEAMEQTVGAVTITGTVGYEAIFGKGRCISVCHPIIATHFPTHSASSPEEAAQKLLANPTAGIGSADLGKKLLDAVWSRSFKGVVSDPTSLPDCLLPDNIELLANAIEKAIQKSALSQRERAVV